ncbi:hypothetical protein [Nocardia nova]|uniref:hypothetical protein n=1 Tax=Nocardia nova TaxID=37330 RepID=UPI001893B209|nr:hypothetical protein [Nocardia nova]MBF6277082.1 hypothetical protein [Nocardia nova]
MSGTHEPVRQPKTDAEWARDQQRRTEGLENPTSQRIGPWVLSASTEGHLIASHVEGGSVILARKPEDVENDPDQIRDDTIPAVSVTRAANQTIPSGGTAVIWDGTRFEVGGSFTGGKSSFDAVTVPVSGIYRASATVHFRDGSGYWLLALFLDDQPMLSGRTGEYSGNANTWTAAYVTGLVQITAGQKVQLWAAAFNNQVIGSSTLTSVPVPSEFSLSLVQRRT